MELNKKKKIILGIIFILIILIAVLIFFLSHKNSNGILFRKTYVNNAWDHKDYGYVIYSNGIIKEYDNINKTRKLRKGKLTESELKELKQLSVKVEDEYVKDTKRKMFDAGLSVYEIYNTKSHKWIVLRKFGDEMGSNDSEESQKILELTQKLYEKYIEQ